MPSLDFETRQRGTKCKTRHLQQTQTSPGKSKANQALSSPSLKAPNSRNNKTSLLPHLHDFPHSFNLHQSCIETSWNEATRHSSIALSSGMPQIELRTRSNNELSRWRLGFKKIAQSRPNRAREEVPTVWNRGWFGELWGTTQHQY